MERLIFDMKPRQAGQTELELRKALLEILNLKDVIRRASSALYVPLLESKDREVKEGIRDVVDMLEGIE